MFAKLVNGALALSVLVSALSVMPANAQVDPTEVKKRKRVIHRCLLDIYIKQSKTPQAIAEYQQVLALDPSDSQMLYAYGTYLTRNGNPAGGIAQLVKAANADPGNPDYAGALGTAYLRTKNFPKAVEYLQRAAALPGGKEKYGKVYEDAFKYVQYEKQRAAMKVKQEQYAKQMQEQKAKAKQEEDDDDW